MGYQEDLLKINCARFQRNFAAGGGEWTLWVRGYLQQLLRSYMR